MHQNLPPTLIALCLCACRIQESPGPTFPEIDQASLSQRQIQSLARAREDYEAVATGKTPKNSVLEFNLRDGGTAYYKGDGYSLTAFHKMVKRHNVSGTLVGPSMTLSRRITGGRPVSFSDIRFKERQ